MKFTHLLHINDPLNLLIDPMTRGQLWLGLVMRARSPALFVPWLDGCQIVAKSASVFERVLRYGEVEIHDVVTLVPEQEIRYKIAAQGEMPASRLVVKIEEPGDALLDVRFSYDDDIEEVPGSLEAFYNSYRRSAYEESDIDTIRILRQFAGEGRLNLPME